MITVMLFINWHFAVIAFCVMPPLFFLIRSSTRRLKAGWKKVKEDNLVLQLDAAKSAGKIAIGIRNVWKEAMERKGRLLVIEKNYMCAADYSNDNEVIIPHDDTRNNAFYIKDAVDDVIERVLDNGGDVEFVDEGLLKEYEKIVLINYY